MPRLAYCKNCDSLESDFSLSEPRDSHPCVDTDGIAANNFNLFALKAGTAIDSWHVQSELLYMVVNQIGGHTLAFPGMYVQAGYFLTGETRPYNRQGGVFGRPEPLQPFSRAGGCGAWELAARWSHIDLNDENIHGGRLNNVTFVINWYLNRFTKFQLNYIHAFLNSPTVWAPATPASSRREPSLPSEVRTGRI